MNDVKQMSITPLSSPLNFSWNLAGKVVYAASRAIILILFAKFGSAEMVGQYALALAITTPIFMLTDLDLRSVFVTDAKKEYELGNYMGVRIIATLIATLVIGILAIMQTDIKVGYVIFFVGILKGFDAISDMLYALMQQSERLDKLGISLIIKGVLSVLVVGQLLLQKYYILECVIGLAVVGLAALLFYDIPSSRTLGKVNIILNKKVSWILFRLSLPLGAVLLFMSLNKNISNYFINAFLGTESLGYFSSIVFIMATGSMVISALGQSTNVKLARYFANGELASFIKLLKKLVWFSVGLGGAMLLAAILAGPQILTLMYRPEYSYHVKLFMLIMLAATISYVGEILYCANLATRKYKIQPLIFGAVLIVGIPVNWIFIHYMGLMGAAWSLIVILFLQLAGNFLNLKSTILNRKNYLIIKENKLRVEKAYSFEELSPEFLIKWKGLLNKSETPFSDPDWLVTWWNIFKQGQKMLIISTYFEDQLVGVFPLAINKRNRQVNLMGYPQASHFDLVVHDDFTDQVIATILVCLQQLKGSSSYNFSGLNARSHAFISMKKQIEESGKRVLITNTISPIIEIESQNYDKFYESKFSSHAKKNNKRDEKRLAIVGSVNVRDLKEADMDAAFDLHDMRWQNKIDTSGFTEINSRRFFSSLLSVNSQRWSAISRGIYLDDRLIAFQYGFLCGRRALLYKSAHDNMLNFYAPGKMMKREFIRKCFKEGMQTVDFGIGYEEYKMEWTDQSDIINSLSFSKGDLLSRFIFFFTFLKGILKNKIKQNRKLVLFKRNTLGKLRFMLTKNY